MLQGKDTPNFFLSGASGTIGDQTRETAKSARGLHDHLAGDTLVLADELVLGLTLEGIAGRCHNATAITIGPRHGPKIGTRRTFWFVSPWKLNSFLSLPSH